MKRKIILFMFMISAVIAFGQNQKSIEETTCTPPKFTGINSTVPILLEGKFPTIENYLGKKVTYPAVAVKELLQGTEVVKFIVTTNGEVSNIEIVNSVSKEIDDEVTEALMTTNGMWKPGNNNRTPVAMEKEISLVFRLEDSHQSFIDLGKKYYSHGADMLFMQQNPKKALKYFNKGVVLFPYDRSLLALRGIALFETGDRNGALHDWNRVKNLGGFEADGYSENLIYMKGYAEMNRVLGK